MKLDDKTTVPLVFVLGALPFIVGAIFWMSSIDAKASKGAAVAEVVVEILQRVVRIETLLEKK